MQALRPSAVTVAIIILVAVGCGSPSAAPTGSPGNEVAPSPDLSPSDIGAHEEERVGQFRASGYFYDLPDPMPDGEPGDLLKLTVRISEAGIRVYRAMYRSTSVDGTTPVAVTGEIWIPGGSPPTGGFPILAFGPGFGGIGDDCAYSIHPERGYPILLQAFVDEGFVVASTDYEGHGTALPYMDSVAESATHSLLDAARAARDLLGPVASDQVLIVGHSLGGVAAAQSLLHGPGYDEGLVVLGVVSIEGVGDFERLAGEAGPDDIGVLDTVRSARSWSLGYPELNLADVLTTDGVELVSRITEDGDCSEAFWLELNGRPLHEIPVREVTTVDWMTVEPWAARIRAQTVPTAPYPVRYVAADGNPLIPNFQIVVDRLCQTADHVWFDVYPSTDHDTVVDVAYPDYLAWLKELLAGSIPAGGCDSR